MTTWSGPVAIVHDNLVEFGGAERLVLGIAQAFSEAPLYTAIYSPERTFPEFASVDVRPLGVNRVGVFNRHHRAALPVLAPAFSGLVVDAAVTLCSSAGWSHGARATGRKVVYCNNPARWLYQDRQYFGESRAFASRLALGILRRPLTAWDQRAARSADRYLVSSTSVRDRVRLTYGIDAEVLAPPLGLDAGGTQEPVQGIDPGYWLCVSRLRPYKNVGAIVEAFRQLPAERLVVVGSGPGEAALRAARPGNVEVVGKCDEAQLRWVYQNCRGLVAASYEDFGLTPLEAAAFGKPVAALRWGGFLDTVSEGETGIFFDDPDPSSIAKAICDVRRTEFSEHSIKKMSAQFSPEAFIARLRKVIEEETQAL